MKMVEEKILEDIETVDREGNEIVLKDVPVLIIDGESYVTLKDVKEAEEKQMVGKDE